MNFKEYTVEHRQNCAIIYGAMPISDFCTITEKAPKGAQLDPHAARLLGANFVVGLQEDLEQLRREAEPEAFARAREEYQDFILTDNELRWLGIGEQGTSSQSLFYLFTGVPPKGFDPDHLSLPRDADDFRRCVQFLDACPENRPCIAEDAEGTVWESLAEDWDDLEDLYRADARTELHDRLKKYREAADAGL